MKNNAQAILLAGYPLEPIVALHVKKTYQLQIEATLAAALANGAFPPRSFTALHLLPWPFSGVKILLARPLPGRLLLHPELFTNPLKIHFYESKKSHCSFTRLYGYGSLRTNH
jgi:hypothetical protein